MIKLTKYLVQVKHELTTMSYRSFRRSCPGIITHRNLSIYIFIQRNSLVMIRVVQSKLITHFCCHFFASCNANEKITQVNLETKTRSTCAREVKKRLTVNFGTECFPSFCQMYLFSFIAKKFLLLGPRNI